MPQDKDPVKSGSVVATRFIEAMIVATLDLFSLSGANRCLCGEFVDHGPKLVDVESAFFVDCPSQFAMAEHPFWDRGWIDVAKRPYV
jgi:hypothetical protein